MPVNSQTIASTVRRVSVTIPGSAGTAVTLQSLIASAIPNELHKVIGGRVNPCSADYTAGDSATSLPLTVTANSSYTEPAANFLSGTYVKASAASTITATISVWLAA